MLKIGKSIDLDELQIMKLEVNKLAISSKRIVLIVATDQ